MIKVNQKLQGKGFGARDLIVNSKVTVVCTTDDPTDHLEYHKQISKLTDSRSFLSYTRREYFGGYFVI
ncbi:UNVERIFIED_CONTAM: glucuronate isomerase [Paenibacillus sp. PvR008]